MVPTPQTNQARAVEASVLAARYSQHTRISRGGYGEVFRAVRRADGQVVALKVLRDPGHPRACDRFYEEALITRHLRHPHTIRLLDVGALGDGTPFMELEYLEGRDLATVLDTEGPLAPDRAVRIARQLLTALAFVHAEGFLHRDVKPQNIMLVREPKAGLEIAKLLDFGLAARDDDDVPPSLVGTPAYMAPEHWTRARIDPRADLFSLGCTLHETLSGERPHSWLSHPVSRSQTFRVHVWTDATPLCELRPGICPPALSKLVMDLMAETPEGRPASAQAALDALDAIDVPGPASEATTPPGRARDNGAAPAVP